MKTSILKLNCFIALLLGSMFIGFEGILTNNTNHLLTGIFLLVLGCFCFMFGKWIREVFDKEEGIR